RCTESRRNLPLELEPSALLPGAGRLPVKDGWRHHVPSPQTTAYGRHGGRGGGVRNSRESPGRCAVSLNEHITAGRTLDPPAGDAIRIESLLLSDRSLRRTGRWAWLHVGHVPLGDLVIEPERVMLPGPVGIDAALAHGLEGALRPQRPDID